MVPNQLFLKSIGQLELLAWNGDDYSLIRASAIIRQLLIDGHCLVDIVNRNYRVRILFPVRYRKFLESGQPGSKSGTFVTVGHNHEGPEVPPEFIEYLGKDAFLSSMVLMADFRRITSRDVICHAANVLGGVHFGSPKDDAQKSLSRGVGTLTNYQGQVLTSNLYILRSICRDVIAGLKPLTKAVRENPDAVIP